LRLVLLGLLLDLRVDRVWNRVRVGHDRRLLLRDLVLDLFLLVAQGDDGRMLLRILLQGGL